MATAMATKRANREKAEAVVPRTVGEVMKRDPVCILTGSSLRDAARLFDEYEISGLPVIDDQERLVGVLSRTDLLRRLLEGPQEARHDEEWLDLLTADSPGNVDVAAARLGTVDDAMSTELVTATAAESLATVAHRMAAERVHRVVVVANDRPVGIVTTLDLLGWFPRRSSPVKRVAPNRR